MDAAIKALGNDVFVQYIVVDQVGSFITESII